jgi:hypothetical protein
MKVSLSLNKVPYREKMDDIIMAYEKAGGDFFVLFFSTTSAVLFSERKIFSSQNKSASAAATAKFQLNEQGHWMKLGMY